MLTAEVLAFTTSVEMQVAASTPPTRLVACATSLIRHPSSPAPEPGPFPPDGKGAGHRRPSPDLGDCQGLS